MSQEVYRELLEVMKKRGGNYAGMDIPEFFSMVEVLFTPEEAELLTEYLLSISKPFPADLLTTADTE